MFAGFLKLAPVCSACGLDLSRAESGDGPAVFIILIVGFLACFGALFTDLSMRPPIWLTLAIWMPLAGAMSLALLRPFKGVMVALQIHNRASEARNG
ncbi:MAG: DUF983 domain-containing protein [Caulobacteraceae bacterium]